MNADEVRVIRPKYFVFLIFALSFGISLSF